jgi:phenylacetate-CoA ligase
MCQKILTEFSRHIGYPLFWKVRGLEVKSKLAKLQTSQWLAREEVEAVQWHRLSKLLQHAYENVPYYRKVFDDLQMKPQDINDYDDFRKLPLLSKDDIRTNFDTLISTNMDRKLMKIDSTGGSTGENISFLEDLTELSNRFANTVRGDSMAGLSPGTRFVELWGAPFDAPRLGFLGNAMIRLAFRKIFLSAYNLSESQMRQYVRCINEFKPEVILAYPSPLYHFATFISALGLKINPITSIITSAETLSEHQRKVIESVFCCKVFNRYGCREFGNLGTECEMHNGIHIFSDMYLVEILRDGSPVGQDELGEIIVTDLHKYGMPFIRYRIGDLGVPSDQLCSCGRGFPLLRELHGRVFDIIVTPDGRYISGTFWTLLSRSVHGIKSFQVVQEAKNKIDIRLVGDDNFRSDSLAILTSRIREKCGDDMHVSFSMVDTIPLTKSGKHRFVISTVPVRFN